MDMFFGDLFPCFFFGFIAFALFLGYMSYQHRENQKASWRTLATTNHLTFARGNLFEGGAYVVGPYRGHHLKLETFQKSQGKSSQTYTRLTVSVNAPAHVHLPNKDILAEPVATKDVVSLFTAIDLPYSLKGQIRVNGQKVYYEQYGLENDVKYLQALFDLLSDLADAYATVVALGGEAVPALYEMATANGHVLREIASQLLAHIGRETTARLKHQAQDLLCPRCFVYCYAHTIRLHWWQSVTYYGCRACGQSRVFQRGRVVAVLDNQLEAEQVQQDGVWRVNWLVRRSLFDFDEVVIVQASDEEVERFAVQVGNDTDPERRSRYKQMLCVVSPDCQLSENTMRILQRMFGNVPILSNPERQPTQKVSLQEEDLLRKSNYHVISRNVMTRNPPNVRHKKDGI